MTALYGMKKYYILRDVAVETNKKMAKDLGIPQSTAITCVKPSGTVSQLVDSASGIHARHNDYYIELYVVITKTLSHSL